MGRRRFSLTLVLVASMLALNVSVASAAVFTVGNGARPRVAVDPSGNGHFTWTDSSSSVSVFHYCRVALGASACSAAATRTPDPANTQNLEGGHALLPGGARVLLQEARCCTVWMQKYLYSSTNGGTSFTAGVSPGFRNDNGAGEGGDALYTPPGALGRPAESVATISDAQTIGLTFQVAGTAADPTFQGGFQMTSGNSYNGSLGLAGNTLVAVWSTLSPANLLWRAWRGTGDVNDPAQWTPAAVAGPTNVDSNASVASGPGGIYVAYATPSSGTTQTFVLRRFTRTGWSAPVAVTETNNPQFGDLYEDPTGRLHFAWQDSNGNLRYRYARSAANTSFSLPQTLSGSRTDGNFAGLELAANASGRGFVTWGFYGGTIKVAPFAPGEPTGALAPVLGRSVLVAPVKGTVYVSAPGGAARSAASVPGLKGKRFVRLTAARLIPAKSYLDTRRGTVRLVSAQNASGAIQSGDFSSGVFQVLQSRTGKGLTELRLKGSSFRRCRARARRSDANAARLSKRRIRRLRSNAKGRFRTRGRYSSATVRGTDWDTQDRCDGTLTRVARGRVAVRDFARKKTIVVRAKKRYLARARR
jgi:hypothetical protein